MQPSEEIQSALLGTLPARSRPLEARLHSSTSAANKEFIKFKIQSHTFHTRQVTKNDSYTARNTVQPQEWSIEE